MCEHVDKKQKASQSTADISVVILAYNEDIHIRRCIENVAPWARDVFVVDCFSTDRTVELAEKLGTQVFQNQWEGLYARQFNWALNHLPVKTKWVLRLDADEYLYPELIEEIQEKLEMLPEDVTGVVFKRRHIFLGKWMKRGTYPVKLLRLFRYGKARCEQRLMDEHIELLEGRAVEFEGDFADHNLNDIGWWTAKHNGYALREAVDLLDLEYGLLGNTDGKVSREGTRMGESRAQEDEVDLPANPREWEATGISCGRRPPLIAKKSPPQPSTRMRWCGLGWVFRDQRKENPTQLSLAEIRGHKRAFFARLCAPTGAVNGVGSRQDQPAGLGAQAAAKRAKKMRYARMPLFFRAFAYFVMRYVVRGGFLEGKEGFLWHFLQGWWYRTLVDAKVWEIKRESGGDREKMLALLRGKYGMKI
jgi:hypothetical protein